MHAADPWTLEYACIASLHCCLLAVFPCLSVCAGAGQRRHRLPRKRSRSPLRQESRRNSFSFVRYRADYEVKADATSVETSEYEILIKTKAGVDNFSQVRLSYSEKMETLEVLAAYTLTPDGSRHDVPADKIYTQESYSSASAAMYADRKVKVIVFPNLSPGTRLVYRIRQAQNIPFFPGYFNLWENLSPFTQYDDAKITLTAPKQLPMHVYTRGVQGSDRPKIEGDSARWSWSYSRKTPMQNQNWSAAGWEYGPTIMASTYPDFSAMGRAYQLKGAEAAKVTPMIQSRADEITKGIGGRREQAKAIYEWVAKNIRYVAVYLGNGGLEPNSAESILANRYGDCKDHTVILEALLAAKGIASTPVLIGAGGGPTLPQSRGAGALQPRHQLRPRVRPVPGFHQSVCALRPIARQRPGRARGAYRRRHDRAHAGQRSATSAPTGRRASTPSVPMAMSAGIPCRTAAPPVKSACAARSRN